METEGFYMAEKRWRTWETVDLMSKGTSGVVIFPRR